MSARVINLIWYAVFHAVVLGTGWAIASTHAGERMAWTGIAIAVIAGPLFAQLSKLARRRTVDKHAVRVELDDFRYAWLWSTLWVGGALGGAWAVADQLLYTSHVERLILALGAGAVLVGGWFTRLAGRRGDYLRVDLAAGVVEHVGAGPTVAAPLAELGPFVIETYRRPYTGRGHNPDWYRLVVPGLPKRVFADTVYPRTVRTLQARLQRRLDELRDIADLRRVLADTPATGETYRAGASVAEAVERAVADPARRRAALEALHRDPDPEIRSRARALAQAPCRGEVVV